MNDNLIRKIKSSKDKEVNNAELKKIIELYAPLVKFIATKISMRLPSNIDIDDLLSAGVIGLMDAVKKYDPTRDNKFKTYAEFRVRGAILDELRAQDWIPRSMREKTKRVERAIQKLEQVFGRSPKEEEVARELRMEVEDFRELLYQCKSISLISLDEVGTFSNGDRKSLLGVIKSGDGDSPLSMLTQEELRDQLSKYIQELPEKQRIVLSLYYFEELNLKEIGQILEVTESRVSQLHTQAVIRLRTKIHNARVEL